jgi:short-subunit dehydrogenase
MSNTLPQKKVALVTGGSSGIGKEITKQLLKDGLVVYVVARRVDKMKELENLGAIPLKMDITKDEEIQEIVEHIQKNHSGVDVLVNNAGYGSYGAMEDTSLEDARYQFEVNLFGLARLTQLVLPSMRAKNSGTIINMSSMGGKVYTPLGSWYHATKHALEGWSDCLRLELSTFNINVVIIEPGVIQTEFSDVMLGPMMQRSGQSAYSELANNLESMTIKAGKGGATPPSVIAEIVSKALKSKRPKTRYVAGKYAKPMIFIRKWFGDRIYDKAIMNLPT